MSCSRAFYVIIYTLFEQDKSTILARDTVQIVFIKNVNYINLIDKRIKLTFENMQVHQVARLRLMSMMLDRFVYLTIVANDFFFKSRFFAFIAQRFYQKKVAGIFAFFAEPIRCAVFFHLRVPDEENRGHRYWAIANNLIRACRRSHMQTNNKSDYRV